MCENGYKPCCVLFQTNTVPSSIFEDRETYCLAEWLKEPKQHLKGHLYSVNSAIQSFV